MMKPVKFLVIFAALLSFYAVADFEKGEACYKEKNYSCAFSEWNQSAVNGDINSQIRLGSLYRMGVNIEKDYVKAAEWYQKAANKGSAEALYSLANMYYHGMGVNKDRVKFFELNTKAAEQGFIHAQLELGFAYYFGSGVKKDYAKALEWYQKAAYAHEPAAQLKLGSMYETGKGVQQDFSKALGWYQKAAEQGYGDSKEKVLKLGEILKCNKTSQTELFGLFLKCANRDQLMSAIRKAGAGVKLEDKNNWGDRYHSSNILKGSSELFVIYTVDDRFAIAQYTFPSHLDAGQVVQVHDFIENKYGKPDKVSGNVSLGKASFEWQLEDGIILTVARGWPDTTTYLSFTHPENYQEVKKEQEKQRKEREAEEYRKQNNAF